ncbi:hypothetical protein NC652_010176 [Populus alba x Populus x berolinensis]|nr:hypothetical protein NC652_010176 [Populus alba x Populus x berolinensis]
MIIIIIKSNCHACLVLSFFQSKEDLNALARRKKEEKRSPKTSSQLSSRRSLQKATKSRANHKTLRKVSQRSSAKIS